MIAADEFMVSPPVSITGVKRVDGSDLVSDFASQLVVSLDWLTLTASELLWDKARLLLIQRVGGEAEFHPLENPTGPYLDVWVAPTGVSIARQNRNKENEYLQGLMTISLPGMYLRLGTWEENLALLAELYRLGFRTGSRGDLAIDDFTKESITPERAFECWSSGKFEGFKKKPKIDQYGHDVSGFTWGKKGSRGSGKQFQIYKAWMLDLNRDYNRAELRLYDHKFRKLLQMFADVKFDSEVCRQIALSVLMSEVRFYQDEEHEQLADWWQLGGCSTSTFHLGSKRRNGTSKVESKSFYIDNHLAMMIFSVAYAHHKAGVCDMDVYVWELLMRGEDMMLEPKRWRTKRKYDRMIQEYLLQLECA